jgi:DNA-binding NtrC family response regulator
MFETECYDRALSAIMSIRAIVLGCDSTLCSDLSRSLVRGGFEVEAAGVAPALPIACPWELVVLVTSARDAQDWIDWLAKFRRHCTTVPVLVVPECGSEDLAVTAFRAGATDYFRAPVKHAQFLSSVRKRLDACASAGGSELVGSSRIMQEVRQAIHTIACYPSTCLITGETGTGKELVAALLHKQSNRSTQPLISINCAAIPDTLLESELFGYERGAFTGADRAYPGKLQEAQGGMVFFDEIGELSPFAQAKLLRAIETHEICRLGSSSRVQIRCRIIAATNQDLEDNVRSGRFRKDLFFRLNVMRLQLPALRDRMEDLAALCRHFIGQFNREFGLVVEGVSDQLLEAMRSYDWPGNVRELRNLLEAAVVRSSGIKIDLEDLPPGFSFLAAGDRVSVDRERLLSTLAATKGNKSKAAVRLNYSRMTLYRKLARYHIESAGTKPRKDSGKRAMAATAGGDNADSSAEGHANS